MSNLKVLDYWISNKGKGITAEIEQPNGEVLEISRTEQRPNEYNYQLENAETVATDITYVISKEIKQKFATIYHEQYQLKNL